ncbi:MULTISPECIES: type VI secretion system protein [unclassified Pseudomonas]|uniref:type VI secretion system protein n=1 Tax=unclassified Pseudomonas TaxID=196821 RepID=UPI002A360EE9|nr:MULTISPECIES: type VI secretion protein IcmF/TssM N-terminal domain-containing protein [unclassified Pseudomonas]MDX9669647.1 type VI secretion protein IcmF/TssM N-terminal domain-containing protein [Pseudomonas sp. P8_250]WPN36321.1 type VI secretion protein IcmF/TssM N-terminal domain-containing protein [Pseudomonas sp. P8_139]WPN41878.1 type VI secretion protein IcmF/TssM N-terminal domain-containing protein [Pseudomonas sp. P8_229]
MSVLTIVAWVVALLLLPVIIAVAVWWLRTQSGAAIRSFYAAVRHMEQEQGSHDRYQMPWLLLLGDEAQGTQLVSEWRLQPTDKPAWFGRWWSDPEGAVLVVPQALFLPDDGMHLQRGGWWRLLGLILRLRSKRPLDGVVWTVPASRLGSLEQSTQLGLAARRRFIDLLQRFGLSVPVYVIITGLEELPGFQELISALPDEARERTLGWSTPYARDAVWQGQWSDQALDRLHRAVSEAVIEIGTLSGHLSADLYALPERLETLRRGLQSVLEPVFQGNAQGEAPCFRGVYLTANQPSDDALDGFSADDSSLQRSAFMRPLWRERLVGERGLAQGVPRLLRLRQRWQRITAGVALVVGVVWAVAMVWIWRDSVRDAHELARLMQGAQKSYVAVTDEAHRIEPTRRNVQSFWRVLEKAPHWHYVSLVFPTSWFSSFDTRIEQELFRSTQRHMLVPLHDLLVAELAKIKAIRSTDRRNSVESEDPAQWQNYQKATDLVDRALRLEQQNQLFGEVQNNQRVPLDDLVQLSNSALSLNLNAATLPHAAYYNRLLAAGDSGDLQALDLSVERPLIVSNFTGLMERWLDQYFLADNFVSKAGYLKLHLEQLEAGSGNSLSELEDLRALIDDLQAAIALTNSTWSRGKGQELVPGYRDFLDKVRKSSLLGPAVEQQLDQQAGKLQQSFRDQWIAQVGSRGNLLVQQGSGQLALQEQVVKLNNAVQALFKRDFVSVAMRASQDNVNLQGQTVDGDDLNTSLSYFASYKSYVAEELPRIPPAYREALLQAAESAAAQAMWLSLKDHNDQTQPYAVFNVKAEQAMALQKAFVEVHRSDLASRLQGALNRRALAQIVSGLEEITAQPLFGGRTEISQWDGSKNLGLQLYGASDVQDLKLSLKQQFNTMLGITERRTSALQWLTTQQGNLSALDYERVTQFSALNDELLKYKDANPASSPAQIEQLVSRDFVEMDTGTCVQTLQTANIAGGRGTLAMRAVELQQSAMQRCQFLQQQQAAAAWNELATYFNQYLADRFPFANGVQAQDADPARVQHFLEIIDKRLAVAQAGLVLSQTPERLAAEDFLNRLKQASVWLTPLFVRDKSGILGVELDVRWRTDREEEKGADQVIAWGLLAGNQQISYPGAEQPNLRWMVGQPIRLTLRWARNGKERPVNDPLQPNLVVRDMEAGWEYGGPWSLLRLMRAHFSVQRQPNLDYTDFPLALRLPVTAATDSVTSESTRMFVRLSLMSQGSKLPLAIPPLPTRAPRSPYQLSGATAALDARKEEGL